LSDDAGGATNVTFSWTEGDLYEAELVGYNIFINDGYNSPGGVPALVATIDDTSVRSYVHTDLVANYPYSVQVSVITTVGESERSAILETRSCGLPSAPDPPTRLSWTDVPAALTVQWTAPAEDNGCPIQGYRLYIDNDLDGVTDGEIYPGVGNDADPTDANLDPTVLEFEQQGLTAKQDYAFRVRAYNTLGSVYSDWATITAAGEPAQMDPPSQDVALSSTTQIALTWTVPALNSGLAVGYKVFRNDGSGTSISTTPDATCGMEANPAPQRCTIMGLTISQEYTFQMLTINEIGEGLNSNLVILKAATRPDAIDTPLNSASADTPALTFTWNAPVSNGATIYNYEWELWDETAGNTLGTGDGGGTAAAPVTTTSKQFTGAGALAVAAAKQYKFRVRGINEMSDVNSAVYALSDWSAWSSIVDPPRGYALSTPDAVTGLGRAPGAPVAGQIPVTWTLLANNVAAGGDQVNTINYKVYGAQTAPLQLLTTINDGATNDYTATVPQGQTWTFRVDTENIAGLESQSTTVALISAGVPDAPSITGSSTVAGQIDLVWVPADNNGALITQYTISLTSYLPNGAVNTGPDIYTVANTETTKSIGPGFGQNNQAAGTTEVTIVATNAVGDSTLGTNTFTTL
jgi:hypothetical protein